MNKLLQYARGGVSLGAFVALATTAFGATITLEQALERAESHNPNLQALREQQSGAQARIVGAASLPDPKLQFTYFGESVETRTGPQEAIYSIQQTVPWLSKLGTRRSLARRDAATLSFVQQHGLLSLRSEVTVAYAEAMYLQEAVHSTEENIRLIEDMRAIVEERVRAGGSLNALLRLEVELERMRDQLERTEQQHYTQRTVLAGLLALKLDELGELETLAPSVQKLPSAGVLQERLSSRNPELLALQERVGSAEAHSKLSRLERYPDLTFGLNYIQVGEARVATSDSGRDPWNVSIAVNLPIWEGRNRSAIQSANAVKRSAEQLYRSRLIELKAELNAAMSRRDDAVRRVDRYTQKLIPLAEQSLENSRSAYEGNQLGVLELIDSERALLELNLNYWRAVANVTQTEATIQALTQF